MIGVTSCLAAEFARGVGLKEQIGEAPVRAIIVSKVYCQVFFSCCWSAVLHCLDFVRSFSVLPFSYGCIVATHIIFLF